MEETSEQSHLKETIMTPNYLKSGVWKYFASYTSYSSKRKVLRQRPVKITDKIARKGGDNI